ncbi:MAG: DUF4350 domain-containing protein [Cyanobacteria bacterium J06627_28]
MTAAKLGRRPIILGVIALVILFALFLLAAPSSNRDVIGSTWGYGPDGYSAWYEYVAKQNVSIERWQRPLSELIEQDAAEKDVAEKDVAEKDDTGEPPSADRPTPKTLLRILPPQSAITTLSFLSDPEASAWVDQGNNLIVLAQDQPATGAPFASSIASDQGAVAIETTRRFEADWQNSRAGKALLIDEAGSVVWQQKGWQSRFSPSEELEDSLATEASKEAFEITEENAPASGTTTSSTVAPGTMTPGTMTLATTPFLAANTFANEPGNFAFLAELVQQGGSSKLYVDEFLHGYKDQDVIIEQVAGNWIGYLTKTPLLIAIAQCGAILLISLVAQNQRLGLKRSVAQPQTNNSEAYMQALAGVLHKANNRDFLVETLTRAERKRLQRALGLGEAPVSLETLQTSWQQNTGRSLAALESLQGAPQDKAGLKSWLRQLQSLPILANKAKQSAD